MVTILNLNISVQNSNRIKRIRSRKPIVVVRQVPQQPQHIVYGGGSDNKPVKSK